jgi:hypothetical protein
VTVQVPRRGRAGARPGQIAPPAGRAGAHHRARLRRSAG